MKKKNLVTILGTLSLAASTGCALMFNTERPIAISSSDGKYDNDTRNVDESMMQLENCFRSVYQVGLKITVTEKNNGSTGIPPTTLSIIGGSSIALQGGYALTAYHVAHSDKIVREQLLSQLPADILDNFTIETSLFLTKDQIEYYKVLEEVAWGEELDFSLLKISDEDLVYSYPYKFGDSNELEVGDFTYLIGAAAGVTNTRPGIVSSVDHTDPFNTQKNIENIAKMFGQVSAADHKYHFNTLTMYSNGISPGDSGGPIFAVRDGNFELVGVASMMAMGVENIGAAVDINPILEEIAKTDPTLPFLKQK